MSMCRIHEPNSLLTLGLLQAGNLWEGSSNKVSNGAQVDAPSAESVPTQRWAYTALNLSEEPWTATATRKCPQDALLSARNRD